MTYCWIDGSGEMMRAKTKWVEKRPTAIEEVDSWHFDGSSTGQAIGSNSDMFLRPVTMRNDPFFPGESMIVLCEVYDAEGKPHATNHRAAAREACEATAHLKPWFGFEQEYTFMGTDGRQYQGDQSR